MYQDRKKNDLLYLIVLAVCLLLAGAGVVGYRNRVPADMEEDTVLSIRKAVRESALQCYAVEGVYPPDIEYLQENYGLRINTDAYIVAYEAFAENQMPNIKVVKRNK